MKTMAFELGKGITKANEGLSLQPYQDSIGIWTVGYGHNCETGKIRQEVADMMFDDDFMSAYNAIKGSVTFFEQLDDVRKYVLVDMAFNMGASKVLKFVKMLNYLQSKDYTSAANEILKSGYAQQVGRRAINNAEMIRTGKIKLIK